MKERLLGAAVLIVAAVLIIPVFLDGSGPTNPRPSDTVSRELQLPVPGSGNAVQPGAETNRTHSVEIETGRGDANLQNRDNDTSLTPGPPPAVPPMQAQSSQAPATLPPAAQTAEAPEVAEVVEQQEAAAPEPVKRPVPVTTGWAVQVGSFSNETNARRLMEHLKGSGYPAFVVRNVVNGRVMFRVRVGPESDQLRAEALLDRLKSDRQQTQLVRHP